MASFLRICFVCFFVLEREGASGGEAEGGVVEGEGENLK